MHGILRRVCELDRLIEYFWYSLQSIKERSNSIFKPQMFRSETKRSALTIYISRTKCNADVLQNLENQII